MVGDYNNDSSYQGNLNLLLRLARVETNVDLKGLRAKVLEGRLQENKDVRGFRDYSEVRRRLGEVLITREDQVDSS